MGDFTPINPVSRVVFSLILIVASKPLLALPLEVKISNHLKDMLAEHTVSSFLVWSYANSPVSPSHSSTNLTPSHSLTNLTPRFYYMFGNFKPGAISTKSIFVQIILKDLFCVYEFQ